MLLDILLMKPGALTICMENPEIPGRIHCIEANGHEHYLGTAAWIRWMRRELECDCHAMKLHFLAHREIILLTKGCKKTNILFKLNILHH